MRGNVIAGCSWGSSNNNNNNNINNHLLQAALNLLALNLHATYSVTNEENKLEPKNWSNGRENMKIEREREWEREWKWKKARWGW